jgi:PhzF family phenazine biosynthesis protein
MGTRPFSQVDVFGSGPMSGNPVAVVHDAVGLEDEELAAFARWTNLSETTFLLPPTDVRADYRLRIFTPGAELPFAGHPTLGSAHAWLEAGGAPRQEGLVVQECGVGLVDVRREGEQLAFAAPTLLRSGPVEPEVLADVTAALRIDPGDVVASAWVDNGPGWVGVQLAGAEQVLALEPDYVRMRGLDVGVIGAHPGGGPADFEVRAFCPDYSIPEDPVTGSLNAAFAVWLIGEGRAPASYTVRQGTALRRSGDVGISSDEDGRIWVRGSCRTLVRGTVDL